MKLVVIVLVAILAFGGTLAMILALSGNLNPEGIDRIMHGPPPPPDPAEVPDGLRDIAAALNEREASLDDEKTAVQQERQRLETLQRQNAELRGELEQLVAQLETMLDTADADQQQRMQAVADSIAAMDPDKAATALASWEADKVARILLLVDEDVRGDILNELAEGGTSRAGIVLDALQASRY